jgi:peptidoglycan/xylan/chitin deacetylase (PgdA/CDA1 family)
MKVIMYHYVRDYDTNEFKNIKVMDISAFEQQIIYLNSNYNIIDPSLILDANYLPRDKDVILTFDDGYRDHYDYVYPILKKYNLSGVFFVSTSVLHGKALVVNKIQHLLALLPIDLVHSEVIRNLRLSYSDVELDKLIIDYSKESRYDDARTMFIKKMLQFVLPDEISIALVNNLFEKHKPLNENDFIDYLYLSKNQIEEMKNNGMYFGAHTFSHPHLAELSYEKQEIEIQRSIDDLAGIGISSDFFCYPYGSYNDDTMSILFGLGVRFAFTTEPKECHSLEYNFSIPRLDCNDISLESNRRNTTSGK